MTSKNRWEDGIEHHPMSVRLMKFLADHDFHDYGMYFDWNVGGDGDNGETLMFQMDAFFELLDRMGEWHTVNEQQESQIDTASSNIKGGEPLVEFSSPASIPNDRTPSSN